MPAINLIVLNVFVVPKQVHISGTQQILTDKNEEFKGKLNQWLAESLALGFFKSLHRHHLSCLTH